MPFVPRRARLTLLPDERSSLEATAASRTAEAREVERARALLAYADGKLISAIARDLRLTRPKVERVVDRALEMGALAALVDRPGRGRDATITADARAWVVEIACIQPKDLGYAEELWSTRLLSEYLRANCVAAGHPSLARIGRGTVSRILSKSSIKPHRIEYYLERRDPDFAEKRAAVLAVYQEVEALRQEGADGAVAVVSYDEKPGIQAIQNLAPDLPPVPGKHPSVARDHEYRRHGTVSLLAGIDLLSGVVHGIVEDRHRSLEFVKFLGTLDEYYPPETRIRVVLDNHSAHTSKETMAWLASHPGRFELVFTPKHGSWLNIIETFFAKMTKQMLRGIRVHSREDLKQRIEIYLEELNEHPVVFRWKHGLEALNVSEGSH